MNPKKYLILFFIIPFSLLKGYEDLGVYGNTHKIKEDSFKLQLHSNYKENFKKDIFLEELKKKYRASFYIKNDLEPCAESTQREFIPEVILEDDISMPYTNEIIYKKGIAYNILKENNIFLNKYLIFIDANDKNQVSLAKAYSKYADIFIVNGDIKPILDDGIKAFVAREKLEAKAFDVKCLPSIYTQQEDSFIVNEYNPEDLKKGKK